MTLDFEKYINVPLHILELENICLAEKLILSFFWGLKSNNKPIYCSNKHLSTLLKVSTRTIQRHLSSLESKGYISKNLTDNRIIEVTYTPNNGTSQLSPPHDNSVTPPRQNCHPYNIDNNKDYIKAPYGPPEGEQQTSSVSLTLDGGTGNQSSIDDNPLVPPSGSVDKSPIPSRRSSPGLSRRKKSRSPVVTPEISAAFHIAWNQVMANPKNPSECQLHEIRKPGDATYTNKIIKQWLERGKTPEDFKQYLVHVYTNHKNWVFGTWGNGRKNTFESISRVCNVQKVADNVIQSDNSLEESGK